MEEKIGYLSDVELFRDLSDRDRTELERMTTLTNVPRGAFSTSLKMSAKCSSSSSKARCSSTASHLKARSW